MKNAVWTVPQFTSLEGFLNASLRRFMLTAGLGALVAAPAVAQNPATPAPSPITVSGVVYAQYAYQMTALQGATDTFHTNAFDVTRAYLNVIGRFSGGIMTRVTADIAHVTNGQQTYRLKYAYAGYNPEGSALTYKLGLMQTPYLDWEEALWDYRMQGTTVLDGPYLSSSNFGADVDGNINKEQVDFQAGIFDNGSYSAGLGDERKDFQARVSVRAMDTDDPSRVGGLRVTGFAQIGKPPTGGTRSRFVGVVSYKSKMLTLAGMFTMATDSVTGATAETKGQVLSAFGVYHFSGTPVAVIARFDHIKPSKDAPSTTVGFTANHIVLGASYQLSPNVRLLLDANLLSEANENTLTAAQQNAFDATKSNLMFQTQFTF
ncbi:MAG TPA: hypothetical protein VN674_05395 [Gemmatimonadales bacterium]|nr:hypothetical protein [Gemmatimonadales bacterium]